MKRALLIAALATLTGCNSNQAIANLQLAVEAADIAFSAVASSAGLPAATQTAVSNYLTAADQALSQASQILAGPGTAAEKAARLTATFAQVASPLLPAGTPQTVVNAVQAVSNAIARFLSQVGAAQGMPATPSAAQKQKLQQIQVRADTAVRAHQ